MSARRWLFLPITGLILGVTILGILSRIAMRVVAHATDAAPGFTWGGSFTVIFLGAGWGVGGAVIYAVLLAALPRRPAIRITIFALILILLTLRGLRPFTPLTLSLFMPLSLIYGALLVIAHRRWRLPNDAPDAPPAPTPSSARTSTPPTGTAGH